MNQRQSLSSSQSSRRRNSTRSSSEATGQPCASQRSNSWSSSRMPRRQRQRTRRSSAAGSVSCGLTLAGSGSGPLLSPPTRALVERGPPRCPFSACRHPPTQAGTPPLMCGAVPCPGAGTFRGRRALSKRWHLAGPPFPVQALAPCGAAIPWGYVPPFGTTSCLYEGPWHIHVPLGTYPQGTASFREPEGRGFDRKSRLARRRTTAVERSSHSRSSVFRASRGATAGWLPRQTAGRSKRCPARAGGRCSAARGVERHMDVPRSRTEAGRRRERRPPVRQNGGPFRSR